MPETRIQTICLVFLSAVASIYLVYWLRPVLVPLVVACFVVSGVSPILKTLEIHLGVSRIVAAGLTFLAGVGILVVFGVSIWMSVLDLSGNAAGYRARVRKLVISVESRLPTVLTRADVSAPKSASGPNVGPESPTEDLSATETAPRADASGELETDAGPHRVPQLVDSLLRQAIASLSQTLASLVSTSIVVLIYVFFLLIGTPSVAQSPAVREIDTQVRSYLSLKTVISIFTGLAFGLALRLFGVPMAFTFGVLAFLLNFVPNVGPLVASLLPIPLIVLDPVGSIAWMISAITVICLIQMISGNLVEPKIMGDQSDLHPVAILVALMFWGMMWGVIGMFLATPITAALKIMLGRFDSTRWLSNLLAGRWDGSDAEPPPATAVSGSPS